MSSKNWNDRADKDLFFTILSVKNIGVISGAEWTTIGNHMRSLGYGFTNEGCRQHFQGLRRAQNKADTNGIVSETASRRVDPTLNPITRRPGPGRGRPRKQSSPVPADDAPVMSGSAPAPGSASVHVSVPVPVPVPVPVSFSGAIPGPYFGAVPAQVSPSVISPAMSHPRPSQEEPSTPTAEKAAAADVVPPPPSVPAATAAVATTTIDSPRPPMMPPDPTAPDVVGDEADLDAESTIPLADQMGSTDEPPLKRQKMEPQDADSEPLDEEAVLALAAHNGSTGPDPYGSEFLVDLVCALHEVAALSPAAKVAIEEFLRNEGHDTSWNAIRRQVMRWTPEVDQRILLAMFQHVTMTAGDWDNVMSELRGDGYNFSESALRSAASSVYPVVVRLFQPL
ncbi:hypothetical protein L249_2394 [Ophiocordyceps polyrhachis-furcata BCC 54312]|uniref:Myb-like domain-containing protein n=1 Tax=Ophiocordyceps polyrhachis-furcata BCC 54312 TaxID=1330021 RepID=A0A367LPE3_9HYPO|nr:hypothetical protein L249_2394 [Ophiocordyceps polyrhachis-furcata BCC 54312]